MHARRPTGIKYRVLAIALLPAVLITLGLITYFVYTRIHELEEDLNERAAAIGEYLAPASEYGVLTGNIDTLKPLLVFTEKEEDLARIAIYNPDGAIVIASPGEEGAHSPGREDIVRYRVPIFLTTVDISDDVDASPGADEIIGYVEVWLTRWPTIQKQKAILLNGFLLSLFVLLVTAVFALRLGRSVTDPVLKMTDAVSRIAAGDKGVRIDIDAGRELNRMAQGINVMAARIDESRAMLQRRVDDATRELTDTIGRLHEANLKAEEANRAKTLFIANMSHEIRTPLNAIKGFTRLLMNEIRDSEYLELIYNASENLQHIVNDIIDLSKIDADRLVLNPAEVDIFELVDDSINMLSFSAFEKGIHLDYLVYDDVPRHLVIDGTRLRQVITNLLGNAIKFTHEGSVEMRVMLEDLRDDECRIRLEIKDTGIGISQENLKKLFNVFTQADASITRQYGGSGLGLSICKSIVKLMDGDIQVASEPGKGTTVHVAFPAAYRTANRAKDHAEPVLGVVGIYARHTLTRSRLMQAIDGMAHGYEIAQTLDEAVDARLDGTNGYGVRIICLDVTESRSTDLKRLCAAASDRNRLLVLLPGKRGKQAQNEHCLVESLYRPASAIRHSLMMICRDGGQAETVMSRFQDLVALVVDDNPANSVLARALLEDLRLRVHVASDSAQAIDRVARSKVDIIFMDVHMPGVSGLETARLIRQRHAAACPLIVALTADAMIDTARVTRDGIFDAVLQKPITEGAFVRVLERLLHPENTADTGISVTVRENGDTVSSTGHAADDFRADDLLARCKQDYPLASHILELGVKQLEGQWQDLMKTDASDREALAGIAHAIKGTCSYCAFRKLQEKASRLEVAARGNDTVDLPGCQNELITAINDFMARKALILDCILKPA